MFLNDLSSETKQFNRINRWLATEFGVSVDQSSSRTNLLEAKQKLEGRKNKIASNSKFNEYHGDKGYVKTLDAITGVKDAMGDQVLALQGGEVPAPDMAAEPAMPEMPAEEPAADVPPAEDTEDMMGGADEVAGPADSPLGREEK